MKQEVYLCEQKGTTFIVVDTEENIQQAIERDKDENRSEFVKYLQSEPIQRQDKRTFRN